MKVIMRDLQNDSKRKIAYVSVADFSEHLANGIFAAEYKNYTMDRYRRLSFIWEGEYV
jgi:hypothetical protein